MTTLHIHMQIAGVLLLALAAMNPLMARHFHWREEMANVSLLTRQVFFVHAFFIFVVVLMFGLLSLCRASVLLGGGPLAAAVLGGMAAFWGARLVVQWFVYDRRLWRGHRFNTAMHFLFTGLWCYLTGVYAAALVMNLKGG